MSANAKGSEGWGAMARLRRLAQRERERERESERERERERELELFGYGVAVQNGDERKFEIGGMGGNYMKDKNKISQKIVRNQEMF